MFLSTTDAFRFIIIFFFLQVLDARPDETHILLPPETGSRLLHQGQEPHRIEGRGLQFVGVGTPFLLIRPRYDR